MFKRNNKIISIKTHLLLTIIFSFPIIGSYAENKPEAISSPEASAEVDKIMEELENGSFIYPDEYMFADGWFISDRKGNQYQRSDLYWQCKRIISYGKNAVPVLLNWINHREGYMRYICASSLKEITGENPVFYTFAEPGQTANGNDRWFEDAVKTWQEWYDKNRVAQDRPHVSKLKGPEAKAWNMFHTAVTSLQDRGDRKLAGRLFREVAEKFSDSHYSKDSEELGALLEAMAKEDASWKEPEEIEKLSLQEKIEYNIYHLRDVNCYQLTQPGTILLNDSGQKKNTYNAAIELKKIGKPVIPFLIKLQGDRPGTLLFVK